MISPDMATAIGLSSFLTVTFADRPLVLAPVLALEEVELRAPFRAFSSLAFLRIKAS